MHRSIPFLLAASAALVPLGHLLPQSAPGADAKIANAVSAAPPAVSAQATVMDWPATEGGPMVTLREGRNGWTCLPDFPVTKGNDPMCLDETWMGLMHAVMTRTAPTVTRPGVGYMLAPGGAWASNTDPYATEATPDNDWGFDGPHIMMVFPDPKALEGLPTKRTPGKSFVMFAGTPYAHIMAPVEVSAKQP